MTDSARAASPASPIEDIPCISSSVVPGHRVERTRLLYRASAVPALCMLLAGLICTLLLWNERPGAGLLFWLGWILSLNLLRLHQVNAFHKASATEQEAPYWYRRFLLGNLASAASLGYALAILVPAGGVFLQGLLYGVIGSTVILASMAYGVSLPAFFGFAVPALLPAALLRLGSGQSLQQGWGALALMVLATLSVVAWQFSRLFNLGLEQRFHNRLLIGRLEREREKAERLNRELSEEVEQRRRAEQELRRAYDGLELRVAERTAELLSTSAELRQSEARLSLALEASGLDLWDWDVRRGEVHHSRLGVGLHDRLCLEGRLRPELHPDDLEMARERLVAHLKGENEVHVIEYRARQVDGSWIWIEDRGRAIERDGEGRVLRMTGTRRDITESRQQAERQRLAATVFDAASEGIVVMDADYRILTVNEACCTLSGYERDQLVGRLVARLPRSTGTRRQYEAMRRGLCRDGSWQGELIEERRDGELYPLWVQLRAVRDSQGRIIHIVAFLSDLSQRWEIEERLRYLSCYDALTGLANRSLLNERLHDAGQRVRQSGHNLALLHIDLDRFKILNESLGHGIADQMLQNISRRLTQALSGADTIARLSGDEFVVVLDRYNSLSGLAQLGSRLLGRIRKPMTVDGHELVISASIGISLMPDNARETALLLRQASMAMRHAKYLGGNTLQFFTERMEVASLDNLQLENQLRKGIVEGQLEVFYQPKLNLRDDRIISAEALLRWNHPQLGLVAPGSFIPLAEATGLIIPLGEFVLRRACEQARSWQLQGLADIRVSVNLSAKQLRQGNLVSLVRQTLEETGLAAALLELELTESQLLDDVENAINTCRQLRALGVQLAIDDFGTGYSSLSYLKRFPVNYVKIDQSFIAELGQSGEDAAIIRAILAMAHALDLKVVAEGVEHQTQMDFLRAQGCDEIQGYLISRPVPAADFARLLAL